MKALFVNRKVVAYVGLRIMKSERVYLQRDIPKSKIKSVGNAEGTLLKAGSQGCELLALPMRIQQDLRAGVTKVQAQKIRWNLA